MRAVSDSFKMNLIRILGFSPHALNSLGLMGGRSGSMRLLVGFVIVVGLAFAAQYIRPQCCMANMPGIEGAWLSNWGLS